METICKADPFVLENDTVFDMLKSYVSSYKALQSTMFTRNNLRIFDTSLADFIHGHCLRFQDFAFSVLKADKTVHIPFCVECGLMPDSPYHQIFECVSFQSYHRDILATSIGNLEVNFHIPLIFNQEEESVRQVLQYQRELGLSGQYTDTELSRICFKKQVQHICSTYQFGDQFLI